MGLMHTIGYTLNISGISEEHKQIITDATDTLKGALDKLRQQLTGVVEDYNWTTEPPTYEKMLEDIHELIQIRDNSWKKDYFQLNPSHPLGSQVANEEN